MTGLLAGVIRDDDPDVFRVIKQGCAEAKKILRTKEFLTPINLVVRPYGYIVVVRVPEQRRSPNLKVGVSPEAGRN